MNTTIHEVGEQIYRISVDVPPEAIPVPGGFTFNQYLLLDEEPLLFHTGPRPFFPFVRVAIEQVMPVKNLRYIGFSHYEQDECGALNEFLAAAPDAQPVCSQVNALINGGGMDRAPNGLADGATLRIGKKRLRWIDAPHLPHGWECGYLFEETTRTLLCGDLFTQPGSGMAPVTEGDILGPSEAMRQGMDYYSHGTATNSLLHKIADTNPVLLACMHGSAWRGNGHNLLRNLAGVLSAKV
ncbi:MAG: MBL fold metallo-hydrolase [Nitrospira sp.]|nr:MBL fold metallo-hydrolase [Nitrospira sp.]